MRAIARSVLSVARSGTASRPPGAAGGRQLQPPGALPPSQPRVPLMPASSRPSTPRRAAAPSAILLVTPQALVRQGVAMTLAAQHPQTRIVEAGSLREAGDLLESRGIDLIVLDLDPAGAEEREHDDRTSAGIRQLASHGLPIVVVASSRQPADVLACVRAGAHAYVAKTGSSSILKHAIALAQFGAQFGAHSGERYIPLPRSALERAPDGRALARLSQRQREIFRLLVAGGSNKEIARELGVLEGTVKVHVRAVMQKLGVRNRTQIAVVAARHGAPPNAEAGLVQKAEPANRATPARSDNVGPGTARSGGR